MKGVYILKETYPHEPYNYYIGVISEPNKFQNILDKYYGKENWKEISFKDVRDSALEWIRKIEVIDSIEGKYITVISCHYYLIDDLF